MEKRNFGRTNLAVSVLGFGGAPIGVLGTPQQEIEKLLNSLLDQGVNVIDTAANYAVRQLPATIVSIVTLGEPVSATVLAAIFLKEQPQRLQLVGGVLVLCGILVSTLPTRRAVGGSR